MAIQQRDIGESAPENCKGSDAFTRAGEAGEKRLAESVAKERQVHLERLLLQYLAPLSQGVAIYRGFDVELRRWQLRNSSGRGEQKMEPADRRLYAEAERAQLAYVSMVRIFRESGAEGKSKLNSFLDTSDMGQITVGLDELEAAVKSIVNSRMLHARLEIETGQLAGRLYLRVKDLDLFEPVHFNNLSDLRDEVEIRLSKMGDSASHESVRVQEMRKRYGITD